MALSWLPAGPGGFARGGGLLCAHCAGGAARGELAACAACRSAVCLGCLRGFALAAHRPGGSRAGAAAVGCPGPRGWWAVAARRRAVAAGLVFPAWPPGPPPPPPSGGPGVAQPPLF